MARAVVALWALLLATLVSFPGRAQEAGAEAKAAAEALFDQGVRLKKEGRYLEAADKLAQSQKLDPGIGTLLYLADCYESAGKLASAWASFREAASLAHEWQDERRKAIADERAQKLAPRLAHLKVDVGANAKLEGLQVKRGDVVLEPAVAGSSLPVDAGEYAIEVTATGYKPHRQKVAIRDGETKAVSVPELVAVGSPAETPVPVPPPPPEEKPDEGTDGKLVGALVLGIGAAAAAGVAVGFAVSAKQLDGDADAFCSGAVCSDPRGAELSQDALAHAAVATAGTVVAGVATAGAVTLLVWSRVEAKDRAWLAPALGPTSAGLIYGRTW